MKEECMASVCRRIAECWGFYFKRVELLEADYVEGWCVAARFRVNGVGYSTDFRSLAMDPALDAEPGRC